MNTETLAESYLASDDMADRTLDMDAAGRKVHDREREDNMLMEHGKEMKDNKLVLGEVGDSKLVHSVEQDNKMVQGEVEDSMMVRGFGEDNKQVLGEEEEECNLVLGEVENGGNLEQEQKTVDTDEAQDGTVEAEDLDQWTQFLMRIFPSYQ